VSLDENHLSFLELMTMVAEVVRQQVPQLDVVEI
jgi:hypothetical protein